MQLLRNLCAWLRRANNYNDLLEKAGADSARARDLGVSISRIRLPSGEEIVLVENLQELEKPEQPEQLEQPEQHNED